MQQQGGSQYGVPPLEMVPQFSSAAAGQRQPRMIGIHGGADHLQHQLVAEAASPISSRSAPQTQVVISRSPATFFDELGSGGAKTSGSADDEGLGAGDEGERGGGVGSRWPRQETLALLKIRSEMDAAFRDATLKGPLWEDVSRKLAELGYTRSAKKCKEKFENVHKYYKRTKEGRAGRQDGKSYRFFSQLEALHSTTTASVSATISSFSSAPPNINSLQPLTADASCPTGASMAAAPPVDRVEPPPPQLTALAPTAVAAGISFSSNTSSSSSSDSDGEDTDDGGVGAGALQDGSRKRKREGWACGSGKTMAFFEGLMKQLMERQEAMQQRFLDTIEKREQDRMVREEAWKRQEMARLNREYELMAQERTMTANRDAAVISFLQKFTGVVTTNPPNPLLEAAAAAAAAAAASAPAAPEASLEEPPPPPPQQQQQEDQPESQRSQQCNEIVIHQPSATSEPADAAASAMVEMAPDGMAGGCLDVVSMSSMKSSSPSSRWPKAEVLALIKLRSGLEMRYLEAGPKGPLWEEISMGMKRLGYNRSTKRCKEKWENINKYFKKVKEGNKKRPEDAKTCPYFHELDAIYRKKQQQETAATNPTPPISVQAEQENNNGGHKNPSTVIRSNIGNGGNHEASGFQMPRSNANNGLSQVFFGGAPNSGSDPALKKPEDIVKELMGQQNHEEDEDDDVDDDDYDDDDVDDEDGKLRYEIQFQRQQSVGASRGGNTAGKVPASAPPSSNAGSFLAMVQ